MKTFDSVASLKLAKLQAGERAETHGYYEKGGTGAARYLVKTEAEALAGGDVLDGYGNLQIANGNWVILCGARTASLESFGITSSGDMSSRVQSAISYFVSKNIGEIPYSTSFTLDNIMTDRQEVAFIGNGEISGHGAYGLRYASTDTPYTRDNIGVNLTATVPALNRPDLRILLVGDSLTGLTPNVVDAEMTYWSFLKRKIQLDNPNKDITFINRGIGGSTLIELDTKSAFPVNNPDWYLDPNTDWMDYVEAESPDVVIVAFGMNDSINMTPATVKSVVNKLRNLPSSPDIVFSTTAVPSTEAGAPFYSTFSTKAEQEGRNYSAGILYSSGKYLGIPVLDVNRHFNIIRGGFDILDTQSKTIVGAALINGAYTSSVECRNWSAVVGVPDHFAYNAGLWIKFGSQGTEVAQIKLNAGGKLSVEVYDRSGLLSITDYDDVAPPNSYHELKIEVYNAGLKVYINDSAANYKAPTAIPLIVGRDLHTPRLGSFPDDFNLGYFNTLVSFAYGEHARYKPSVKNSDVWGVTADNTGTQQPYGSNGLNHPTSIGAVEIFAKPINASNFSAPSQDYVEVLTWADGTYIEANGIVTSISGRWLAGTTGSRIDVEIAYPFTIQNATGYSITTSGGLNVDDLSSEALKNAQTLVNTSRPTNSGFDMSVHCLTETGVGRFVDWRVDVNY